MQETVFDPTVINIDTNSIDEPFEYLYPFFQQIKDINIKDFNFEIFEKYIEELSLDEYETLWDEKIRSLLQEINSNYLIIDTEDLEKSDTKTCQIAFIKHIEFLMDTLPYKVIFAKYIKKPFKSLTELENWLSEQDISNDLAQLLEEDIVIVKNMYNLIKTTILGSKRSVAEHKQRVEKLKTFINHENDFKIHFINIVKDTDNENLKNLILEYYKNEYL